MSRLESACPFGPGGRASHCESCLEASQSIPPCVKAWLRTEAELSTVAKVVPLDEVRRRAA